MHIYVRCGAPMSMGRSGIVTMALALAVLVVVGILVYLYVLPAESVTVSATSRVTVARSRVLMAETATTVSRTVTATQLATVTRVVEARPRLIASLVIAKHDQLPASSYVAIYSWWSHAPYTPVVFAPNSRYFAVGLVKYVEGKPVAELRVYSVGGKLLWSYSFGQGYPYSLAWTWDSRVLVVGTQSVAAQIIAFNASSGEVLWSYDVWKDIGRGSPSASRWKWPTVYAVDSYGDRVYAVACRSITKPYTKICKIYALDVSTGRVLWMIPSSSSFIDTAVPWIRVSPDGRYLAAVTWYYTGEHWRGGTLVLIDTSRGEIVKSFFPGLRPPFRWAGSWRGAAWLDSNHLAFCLDDGRLYVLEVPSLSIVQELNVTSPLPALVMPKKTRNATEGYVYAFAGYAYVAKTPGGSTILVLRTSNTYGITASGKSATPLINHPDALSLFFYAWRDGGLEFVAKYPLKGCTCYYQNFVTDSPSRGLLAVPVGHDYIARTYVYTGLYIYNLTDLSALASGQGEVAVVKPPADSGVVISGAISPNGKYVVIVTYPINVGTEKQLKPVGLYGIYVYTLG